MPCAEKEAKRKAAELKKEEKRKLLESDYQVRASRWLTGINKDLTKLPAAISIVQQATDMEVRRTWKHRLQNLHSQITDFRKSFEKLLRKARRSTARA